MAYFEPGDLEWIMDNNVLLELGTDELHIEIKISENSIEIVTSSPREARAMIGTVQYVIIIPYYECNNNRV